MIDLLENKNNNEKAHEENNVKISLSKKSFHAKKQKNEKCC